MNFKIIPLFMPEKCLRSCNRLDSAVVSEYVHGYFYSTRLVEIWELFSGPRSGFKATAYPRVMQSSRYEFFPIETPGHTADHVCLLEPNKGWLFTGDLYITPRPKVFLKEESMTAYIESIQKLNELDYDTVFCGHEGVIPNLIRSCYRE